MTKPLYIIYITGLGDSDPKSQRWVVSKWRPQAELFQVNWGDGEAWAPKFKRLLALIDKKTKTHDVGLVGISAGAGAAINAYAARKKKIVGVVLISGKVNRPESIGPNYRRENPAFVTSAYDAARALATLTDKDRSRILSRYAVKDGIVPKPNSYIPGARNRTSPSIGHSFTIAMQITLGAPSLIRWLKHLQQSSK